MLDHIIWCITPQYRKTEDNVHCLWVRTTKRIIGFCWECQPPIWWLPKLQFDKNKYLRIGWLFFAVGIMWTKRP